MGGVSVVIGVEWGFLVVLLRGVAGVFVELCCCVGSVQIWSGLVVLVLWGRLC